MSAKRRREWPPLWGWELDLWDHVEDRMEDRPFTEVDLRRMIVRAAGHRSARRPGRFIIETKHNGRRWHVIVKPDYDAELLEVITAYPERRRAK